MDTMILRIIVGALAAALLGCLAGVIYLAARSLPLPDVLVATTGLLAGGLLTALIPSRPSGGPSGG